MFLINTVFFFRREFICVTCVNWPTESIISCTHYTRMCRCAWDVYIEIECLLRKQLISIFFFSLTIYTEFKESVCARSIWRFQIVCLCVSATHESDEKNTLRCTTCCWFWIWTGLYSYGVLKIHIFFILLYGRRSTSTMHSISLLSMRCYWWKNRLCEKKTCFRVSTFALEIERKIFQRILDN